MDGANRERGMYGFWVDMLAVRIVRCQLVGFQRKYSHKLEVVEVV